MASLLQLLDKQFEVYDSQSNENITVYAPTKEGAVLEASRVTCGSAYWDSHLLVITETYVNLGRFTVFTEEN